MHRLRPYPVTAFCAVTLFIWVNRIWLTWTNGTDSTARKVLWTLPIGAFVVSAVVLLGAMLRGADRDARWFRTLVEAFAIGTAIYWGVRMPMIALNQHPDLTMTGLEPDHPLRTAPARQLLHHPQRESDGERRSDAKRALDRNVAAHQPRIRTADRKAEPRAFLRVHPAGRLRERDEAPAQFVGRNSVSRVANSEDRASIYP